MPWTGAELRRTLATAPKARKRAAKVTEAPGDRNYVPPNLGVVPVPAPTVMPTSKGDPLTALGEEIAARLPTLHTRGTFSGGKWLVHVKHLAIESDRRIMLDVMLARPGFRPANEAHFRALVESITLLGRTWKALTIDVALDLIDYLPTELYRWEDGEMRIVDTAHIVLGPSDEVPNAAHSWAGL